VEGFSSAFELQEGMEVGAPLSNLRASLKAFLEGLQRNELFVGAFATLDAERLKQIDTLINISLAQLENRRSAHSLRNHWIHAKLYTTHAGQPLQESRLTQTRVPRNIYLLIACPFGIIRSCNPRRPALCMAYVQSPPLLILANKRKWSIDPGIYFT
jgi:hypothetical protein